MAPMSRTWWGQKFIAALEASSDDPARLGRGRSYVHNGRIQSWTLKNSVVTAKVRGSVNPYLGVYKEPLYTTRLQFKPVSAVKWRRVLDDIGHRAGIIARLLIGEMPEAIETVFRNAGLNLLPVGMRDFTTDCSCLDSYNPCKHVAAVYYTLAAQLDQNPLLLFELRGLTQDKLRAALLATPLGHVLAEELLTDKLPAPQPAASYFTRPQRQSLAATYGDFWGDHLLLPAEQVPSAPLLPTILARKGGERPAFWESEEPFIDTLAELYERVRKGNRKGL